MTTSSTPVLIVGAGPVGLTLACELARRDVPIRIIDKLTGPTEQSRAIVLHSRSLEMLRRVGVVDEFIATGLRSVGMTVHSGSEVLADLKFESVESCYPYSLTTPQTETERILAERLRQLGVEVERGTELVSFEQDDSGVHCVLHHSGELPEAATVSWIVGTDGSHSSVRSLTGQSLKGSFEGERFMLGDVDAVVSLQQDRMHLFFDAAGTVLVFPMVGQRMRILAEVDSADQVATVERLQQLVEERATPIQIVSSRWLTIFEIHRGQVPQYRVRRALLAGDAAHVHSPAAGQGMNVGIQDAFNLGWKLAAVAQGADERLLDSYHQERHPVAAGIIRKTTALTKVGTLRRPAAQKIRNAAFRGVGRVDLLLRAAADQLEEVTVNYRKSPLVEGSKDRRGLQPGDHAPDVPGTDIGPRLAAVPGYTALVFGVLDDQTQRALSGLTTFVVSADPEQSELNTQAIFDGDGAVARRYGRRAGDVVIVRPDGYIGLVTGRDALGSIATFRAYAEVGS